MKVRRDYTAFVDPADFDHFCRRAEVTPLQEQALRLRYLQRLPDHEAAAQLGIAVYTFQNRLSRGKREIYEALLLYDLREQFALLTATLELMALPEQPEEVINSNAEFARHLLQIIKRRVHGKGCGGGMPRPVMVAVEDVLARYREVWRDGPDFWQRLVERD